LPNIAKNDAVVNLIALRPLIMFIIFLKLKEVKLLAVIEYIIHGYK